MNCYEHCYYETSGRQYFDYTLYTNDKVSNCSLSKHSPILVNSRVRKKIENNGYVPDTTTKVPKGSEIYVAPNCIYGSADIRRNYSIKRNADSGQYNVFSPQQRPSYVCWAINHNTDVYMFTHHKMALCASSLNDAITLFGNLTGGTEPDTDEIEVLPRLETTLFSLKLPECYKALLDGTLKKPVVSCKCLDIDSEYALSVDTLIMVLKASRSITQDGLKNYRIQLNVLSQQAWRKYPGTIGMLMHLAKSGKGTVGVRCNCKSSMLTKQEAELVNLGKAPLYSTSFAGSEDFALAQQFFTSLLNMEGHKFANLTDVLNVLHENMINPDLFLTFFDCVVRITPKAM